MRDQNAIDRCHVEANLAGAPPVEDIIERVAWMRQHAEIADREYAMVLDSIAVRVPMQADETVIDGIDRVLAERDGCRLEMAKARNDATDARSRYDLLAIDFGEFRDRIRVKQIATFRYAAKRAIEGARDCESADDVTVPRKWIEIMRGILVASPDETTDGE